MYDDFLARILEPDTCLPSQFWGNRGLSRQLEGEKRLMIAVLKDAVECLEKYRTSRNGLGCELYENSLNWIEDKGTEWLFSFDNICGLLGFDPDYTRGFLLKREQKLARPARGKLYSLSASA
ncbi:MAG TPA: hypothetical protein VGL11_06500 [Candidatus Binatia bacterium]|jgi:hypothetical protein